MPICFNIQYFSTEYTVWRCHHTILRQKQMEQKKEHFHSLQWHSHGHRPRVRDTKLSLSMRHGCLSQMKKGICYHFLSLLEIRSVSESSVFWGLFLVAGKICWELIAGLCAWQWVGNHTLGTHHSVFSFTSMKRIRPGIPGCSRNRVFK